MLSEALVGNPSFFCRLTQLLVLRTPPQYQLPSKQGLLSTCLCVQNSLSSQGRHHWISGPPNLVRAYFDLATSTETLFLNKVAFTGTRCRTATNILERHTSHEPSIREFVPTAHPAEGTFTGQPRWPEVFPTRNYRASQLRLLNRSENVITISLSL
jgi:hypothetical protein